MKPERQVFVSTQGPLEVLALAPQAVGMLFDVPEPDKPTVHKGIAVVSIRGPLCHGSSWFWDSYQDIVKRVRSAMASEEVKAVVMRIDSPGGDAAGTFEAHAALQRASKKSGKPLYAYVDELAASAGYCLACAAKEIWLPKAGNVGSIGVIGTLWDRSAKNEKDGIRVELITTGKHKADGHPDQPLTDDAIAEAQSKVDILGKQFFELVAAARDLNTNSVRKLEARSFIGQSALDVGLADGLSGWDNFMRRVGRELDGSAESQTMDPKDAPSGDGQAQSEEDPMKLTKTKALAALKNAKTEEERSKAAKALLEILAGRKCEDEDEEDEDDAEDESEEDESEEDESEEDEEDEADEDEDKDDEDGDEDKDDKDTSTGADADDAEASSLLGGKTGLYTAHRLYRLAKQTTGQTRIREVFGALAAMGDRLKAADKLSKKVAKLETESKRGRVDAMLAKARRDGRITKAEIDSLRAQGMKDPRWLKGYLSTRPKIVATLEDGAVRVTADQAASGDPSSMTKDQREMVRQYASQSGKSFEDAAKDLAKIVNSNAPATPKF